MTYRDLIRTFEIIAKYDGGLDHKCLNMWAEHDEHGIAFDSDWDVSVDDIRELAAMGWLLGCDSEYNEEDFEKWENYKELTDEEIKELFSEYNGIFTFE